MRRGPRHPVVTSLYQPRGDTPPQVRISEGFRNKRPSVPVAAEGVDAPEGPLETAAEIGRRAVSILTEVGDASPYQGLREVPQDLTGTPFIVVLPLYKKEGP